MKRDMDLARKILLKIEELPSYDKPVNIEIEGYAEEDIQHHLELLHEAKLIEVPDDGTATLWTKVNLTPTRLTWPGHEFLDVARNDTNWQKAKKFVTDKGGSLTFDVIKAVLAQLARQAVGLP